jgi:class 3 adenylate cyclase
MYLTTLIRRTGAGVTTPNDRLRMVRLRRSLEWRARHNPHDAEPWLAFVTAERLRSKGDDGALQHYLRTATMAHDRGMSHLEALALDEAAALQGARGHLTVAAHLHHMATETWRRHGALAKLRVRESVAMDPGAADADPLGALDARALLETVHALSGEIELDKLLERVMAVALQGAGANRGLLLLAGDDGLEVASCAEATGDGITMSPPADAAELHATTVVDLAVRTGRPVAIDDATTDDVFRHDPHVVAHQSRSILCVPLMRTGELVGVLYLENTLGVGSFTERDQALIEAIGGQAAVSVENARLFEHERAQTEAFAHFVPRPFLQQLERRSVMDVRLGDAVRADLAVLFSDLRGFTSLSERLGVDASFALLNEYLAEMEPPIHANGGFVDKFIGDGIMALFVDRTEGAVAAAVGMHAALRRFNLRDDLPTLQMGIGIHAGPAMLGTVGSSDRMETTVIGDTVNTASRIEGMTKAYAAPTLVSEAVAGRLTDPMHFTLRQVGRVRALGKEHDTTVFEVLDGRTPEERTALAGTLAKFEAALEAWYAGDLAMARDGFAECHAAAPFDLLAEAYVGRCSSVLAKGVPEDWDGVDVRSDK